MRSSSCGSGRISSSTRSSLKHRGRRADRRSMRRFGLLPLLVLVLAPSAAASGPRATSWAQPQIKTVTKAGLMGGDPASFRPDALLTRAALAALVAGLTQDAATTPADPSAPVTMTQLDAALVGALGLGDVARTFADAAREAHLDPPARFGTEVVARLLGLRTDHPAARTPSSS